MISNFFEESISSRTNHVAACNDGASGAVVNLARFAMLEKNHDMVISDSNSDIEPNNLRRAEKKQEACLEGLKVLK